MKLAVLFSGGKDSCLALHKAKEEGNEIKKFHIWEELGWPGVKAITDALK